MTSPTPYPLLAGKTVLLLGASRGIGEGVARAAFAAGAKVALAARDMERLATLAEELDPARERAFAIRADMADSATLEAAVGEVVQRFGRLDVAINNAGFQTARTPFLETTEEMFEAAVAVNLRGVFVAMKHEIHAMVAGGGGAIVNTSSAMGTIAAPFIAPYVATKHGLHGLTKAAAVEFAARGIRVNAVAPGAVMTEMLRLGPASSPEALQRITAATPMARLGTIDEIAAVIVWLASDQAAYMTGAILPVDGGLVVP